MVTNPPSNIAEGTLSTAVQERLELVAAFPGTSAYTSAKEETETLPVTIMAVLKSKSEVAAAVAKVKLEIDGKLETLEYGVPATTVLKIAFSFVVKRAGKWKMTIEGAAESLVIARQALTPV